MIAGLARARVVLIAAAAVVLGAGSAQAAGRRLCDARRGFEQASDGTHRVYSRLHAVGPDGAGNVTTVFSCRIGRPWPSRVLSRRRNTSGDSFSTRRALLHGRWLLLIVEEGRGQHDGEHAWVYDLRTGERTPGDLYVENLNQDLAVLPFDAVLGAHGGFAARLPDGSVHAYDDAGDVTLTASGATLAIADDRVYWTAGAGTLGSATLGGPFRDRIRLDG